jgi:DNA replication protein DnaC
LTLDPKVGPVLYEIIAGRYEKGATVITSNKSLSTWGDLVGDSALMMAIIDRLLHHGEVFYPTRVLPTACGEKNRFH